MLTMLIAGHDTSTALLAWTLYLLGAHPDALARVRDEVDNVIGDAEPAPELTHQLTYLEMVLKETLRLYPPIHMGNRQAQANLDFGGYHIPRSNRVMLSIYASHRDPAHWDEPDAFRPERFDPHQRGEGPPPFTYIPFGGGPRNCIGAAFGQEESRIVLARIVQQFDVTLVNHDVHPHMGATLEPRPGVMMRVSRRQ
jgi:cytochrome P450